jgi:CheY-like chemotaxis protein
MPAATETINVLPAVQGFEVGKKHLLSIDDDAETLRQRALLLESSGYSVMSTQSAQEALGLLAREPQVDLVLLDYMMPGMRGDELAHHLKRQYPKLPLIAVSAANELPQSFQEIVNASVRKGQDPQVLLGTIAEILSENGEEPASSDGERTVLCVEDEELQLRARRMLFEAAGYRVLEARSAKSAIDLFAAHLPDAVVMDYWLSDQDGNGTVVAEQMKRMRPRTPILMLSGFTALPGEGALVDSWIRKSQIDPDKLVKEVDRLIKLRQIRSQNNQPE